ncbi:uncharacterized protein LOC62_02G003150 [Vanrija pseudolonga]|uniref:Uncharacterized protein n=1 Tax=Vanrija pseudolonga TaxID=143232 RepID=A0AAF1BJ96_9TREE|nr:hypothetical protein LOC62_02G003150 [Vanrija pseudolonga]
MATSRLSSLLNTARTLPPTPFRAAPAPQLSDALNGVVTRSFGLPLKAGDAAVAARAESLSTVEEGAADSALAALERLRAGAALREFPVSATTTHPRHDPYYYTRMRDGVHRAQLGIGRSWWKRFFQVRGKE